MSAVFPFDSDTGAEACRRLFDHFGIDPELSGVAQLEAIAGVFARIPYENLTKIIRRHDKEGSRVVASSNTCRGNHCMWTTPR